MSIAQKLDQLGRSLDAKLAKHALAKKARLLRAGSIVWPYFDLTAAPPLEADDIRKAAVEHYHGNYRRWLELTRPTATERLNSPA